MKKTPEMQYIDIVLLGDFNPIIFSPAWFAYHDLLRDSEAESAEVSLIHSDITLFSIPWCRIQVTRERFSIFTEQEAYFPFLRDLVVGTFQLLYHTPIQALGLNHGMHIKFDSEEQWHAFGHFLVPQKPWTNVIDNSGMLRLEIVSKEEPENLLDGILRIRTEPSQKIKPGVHFNINKHFSIQDKQKLGCKKSLEIIETNWDSTNLQAEEIVKTILTNFEGTYNNE